MIAFTFLTIRSIEKVLHQSKKPTSRFWWISTFRGYWVQKSHFWHVVCVPVCVSIYGHYNSKNNWASSTKFGMRSYTIKCSTGIAYEQNRPTGLASALSAQFFFLVKSALKMCCTKIFLQTKVVTNYNTQLLVQKFIWSFHGLGLCLDCTIRFFAEKYLKNFVVQKFFSDKSCYKSKAVTFVLCNIFRYLAPFWSYSGFLWYAVGSVSRKYCAALRNKFFFALRA